MFTFGVILLGAGMVLAGLPPDRPDNYETDMEDQSQPKGRFIRLKYRKAVETN